VETTGPGLERSQGLMQLSNESVTVFPRIRFHVKLNVLVEGNGSKAQRTFTSFRNPTLSGSFCGGLQFVKVKGRNDAKLLA
jgi:hypothetical protein